MTNAIANTPATPRKMYNTRQDTLSTRNTKLIMMAIAAPITHRAMCFNLKFAGAL